MIYSSSSLLFSVDVSYICLPRRFRYFFLGANERPSLFAGRFVRALELEHTYSSWLDDSTSELSKEFEVYDDEDCKRKNKFQ